MISIPLVSGLSKLQWFNVSNNKLQWFDYAFVPMSLEWLDIQFNEIEELGNYYKLKSGFNLKRLDASGNLIQSLNKLSLPMSLEIIGKIFVIVYWVLQRIIVAVFWTWEDFLHVCTMNIKHKIQKLSRFLRCIRNMYSI